MAVVIRRMCVFACMCWKRERNEKQRKITLVLGEDVWFDLFLIIKMYACFCSILPRIWFRTVWIVQRNTGKVQLFGMLTRGEELLLPTVFLPEKAGSQNTANYWSYQWTWTFEQMFIFDGEIYYFFISNATSCFFPPQALTPAAVNIYITWIGKRKETEALMRGPHLNKSTRLLFKMLQLFSGAKLAPVAKGGTSNHLDMTFLNLAQFWSISRTPKQLNEWRESKLFFSFFFFPQSHLFCSERK